jgi:hypothetical protein
MGKNTLDALSRALRDGDPLAHESGLSAEDAAAIRRVVIAAAHRQPSPATAWPRPLMLAATLAMTIVAGVLVGRVLPHTHETRPTTPPAAAPATDAARRQMQFATPGGTRIIWVFDPEFNP